MRAIPEKYRPLVIAIMLIGTAGLISFTIDLFDIGKEGVTDCCATEFDPAPFEWKP